MFRPTTKEDADKRFKLFYKKDMMISRPRPFIKSSVPQGRLAVLALAALLLFIVVEVGKARQADPLAKQKRQAETLMCQAMQIVHEEKARLGIAGDPFVDPKQTGMIGLPFNDLTTTRGSLAAKQLSTDPAFAAALVEMLFRAGVKSGDKVAVIFSGSFPALNIAVLSASRVLNLQLVIQSSVGASMYGANQPEMTWLDMEKILFARGLFPYRSSAASLGGIKETKGGLDGEGSKAGLEAIRRNEIPLLTLGTAEASLAEELEKSLALFDRALGGGKPAAFINVGGTSLALGAGLEGHRLETGLLKKVPLANHPARGMIFRMGERGVPVIHLLKIKKIAVEYGIPLDPLPTNTRFNRQAASGSYSGKMAAAALVLLMVLLLLSRTKNFRRRVGLGD